MAKAALADLFPGFAPRWIDVADDVRLFARVGGEGPPLLLLHGYPQTHVCWRKVAPLLAERFTVVLPDLRGYGWSSVPPPAPESYAKRVMAEDIVNLMRAMGHERFAVAGHDRGGRVGYRLALDHPERVTKLAVLDIVPTERMWAGFGRARALSAYHWAFLAQPAPFPETLIAADPTYFLEWTLASWTAAKTLDAFGCEALNHYRAFFADPGRVAATCADYRAGATLDVAHDEADRAAGRRIAAPVLALWGETGFPGQGGGRPVDVWRDWADDVRGEALACGHFLPEEAPQATAKALLTFFGDLV
ncbi:alpha/beta fold hydrolase [Methylopila sp. Yamaguchi]|uniref:alpha/beta fold hydrolase n=1 Tax=Methylopila sp. Yamaguchi TaxID=1437817 RepID=UPI000CBEE658|nr:alpha/beta hydrolase [Methylopila sp. Yamaguchi]GBD48447.1 epoxide hydrolase [Methylopila sp. Yamaguchi]